MDGESVCIICTPTGALQVRRGAGGDGGGLSRDEEAKETTRSTGSAVRAEAEKGSVAVLVVAPVAVMIVADMGSGVELGVGVAVVGGTLLAVVEVAAVAVVAGMAMVKAASVGVGLTLELTAAFPFKPSIKTTTGPRLLDLLPPPPTRPSTCSAVSPASATCLCSSDWLGWLESSCA